MHSYMNIIQCIKNERERERGGGEEERERETANLLLFLIYYDIMCHDTFALTCF